eukprot:Skav203282  [mRNA]  locus=scaffold324:237923:240325:+ [translate_table: standard]
MALPSHYFLLWVLSRAGFCQTKSECWQGGFTEELCCNEAHPEGNLDCWDGNFYTYDLCCPPAGIAVNSSGLDDWSCWTGGFTQEACCDHAVSPRGNPACWLGEYTYERCCSPNNKKHELLHEIRGESEGCWQGNHDLEKICCNPREDKETVRICWQSGYNYYDCCKRDPTLVASLVAIRLEAESVLGLLPEAKDQELDLPFQPPSCQSNEGFVDRTVCGHLQQAEDMLRHQLDFGCWSAEYTREYCCNPRLPHGHISCWDLEHTFERCCLGVNPQIAVLQEFYRCEHCISMFQQPRFTCVEIELCRRRYGGTIVAMSQGSSSLFRHTHVEVLCLPKLGEAIGGSGIAAATFALQWVKVHHRQQAQVDLLHGVDTSSVLEVAVMFAPWLAFGFSRFATAIRGSPQPVLKEQLQSGRIMTIDGARLIGTAAVVLIHMNIHFPMKDPQLNARRLMWFYAIRFTDIFGVLSVLVMQSRSESLLTSADALWRKLGRQLPLSFIMVRLATWTAGLCPHFDLSCENMNNSSWSVDLLVRCLTFSHYWHLSLDIRIWLFFRILYWFNQRIPPGVVLVLAALICFWMVYPFEKTFHQEIYFEFWPYRLPMSLLVYAFSMKQMQLQRWALQHPLLWCSTAALLCSLGWVRCIPEPIEPTSDSFRKIPCTLSGWTFFWGGVFFHLGVAMFCIQPCVSMPRALDWMVRRLSPLAFGILALHMEVFFLLERCERMLTPWFSFITKIRVYHWDDPPRWLTLASWACALVICVLAAQVALGIVQKPWERCWLRCPKPVSRVLVLAYVLFFMREML